MGDPDDHPAEIEESAEVYLLSRLTPTVIKAALVLIVLAVGALGLLVVLVSPDG